MTRPLQDYVDAFKSAIDENPNKLEPMLAFFYGLTAAYALLSSAKCPGEVQIAMDELKERFDRMSYELRKRGMN